MEELKPLENFKELQVLDLFNNEATTIDSYREKIFALIPSLVYLDGFDVHENEAVSEGDDDGKYSAQINHIQNFLDSIFQFFSSFSIFQMRPMVMFPMKKGTKVSKFFQYFFGRR